MDTLRKCINPDAMGPSQGLYSQIVVTGSLAFVAGQVSIDKDGSFLGRGDAYIQTKQILLNLDAAIMSLGETWGSVVRLTTYLTSETYIPDFGKARKELFDRVYSAGDYPAHTLMVVKALSAPDHLVELDAVIALKRSAVGG